MTYEYFNSLLTDDLLSYENRTSRDSEESLSCDICGQRFDTVESLKEYKLSEVNDVELKDKGVDLASDFVICHDFMRS